VRWTGAVFRGGDERSVRSTFRGGAYSRCVCRDGCSVRGAVVRGAVRCVGGGEAERCGASTGFLAGSCTRRGAFSAGVVREVGAVRVAGGAAVRLDEGERVSERGVAVRDGGVAGVVREGAVPPVAFLCGAKREDGSPSALRFSPREGVVLAFGVVRAFGVARSLGVVRAFGVARSFGVVRAFGVARSFGVVRAFGGVARSFGATRAFGVVGARTAGFAGAPRVGVVPGARAGNGFGAGAF
jgi:hypothetical protein